MTVTVGDRFTVSESYAVKNRNGRVLANYRPEFDYRVTSHNVGIVNELIAAGKAAKGAYSQRGSASRFEAQASKLTGKVAVKPKGKGK